MPEGKTVCTVQNAEQLYNEMYEAEQIIFVAAPIPIAGWSLEMVQNSQNEWEEKWVIRWAWWAI